MGALELKAVTKSFGTVDVIKGVDLMVDEGEFCVFVGPSGCGKSTLLRIIAGLEDASSGDILLAGKRVNEPVSAMACFLLTYGPQDPPVTLRSSS